MGNISRKFKFQLKQFKQKKDVSDESLVFITPYIIKPADKNSWYKYLERTFIKTGIENKNEAYEFLMKYGLNTNYWNEYIFQAYSNSTQNAIFLTGIPDLPDTLPHSPENSFKF